MNFPPNSLDFEGRTLSDDSNPVEVGVALAPTPDGPIVRADGSVEPVWKTPKRIALAIAALDFYRCTEFDPR